MLKKLAIFDLDGTIVDAFDSIYETISFICDKLNLKKFDYLTVKKAVGSGDLKLMSNLFKDEEIIKLSHTLYRENYLRFLKGNVKVIDGTFDLFEELKRRNIKIALATNRSRFSLIPLLEETKLKNFFDFLVCADDVRKIKPDPEMILKIIEEFKFKKNDVFYVGDMMIDYLAGKNAGIDTFIVLTGVSDKKDFENINEVLIFENLFKLKNFLIDNKLI
ncbi:MAG: HAD family hydrolase [Candidatus Omnitrophica bacterium]|nr:HAD family hydrolase [Candidatus Omnitrophota bacterium]MCM8806424.1 HAD family hydrolase [Candidatus Omnitrophota bacterium]